MAALRVVLRLVAVLNCNQYSNALSFGMWRMRERYHKRYALVEDLSAIGMSRHIDGETMRVVNY